MSETETHTGSLKPFPRNENESDEAYIGRYFAYKGATLDPNCTDVIDNFMEDFEYNDKAFWVDGEIYDVLRHKEHEYDDICEAHYNADGTIDFVAKFYNGGCCLSEAINSAIENLKKNS